MRRTTSGQTFRVFRRYFRTGTARAFCDQWLPELESYAR